MAEQEKQTGNSGGIRDRIQALAEHLEHVLPGQAPIQDFVHHNTLHGYQHLPFDQALKAARERTGASGYLPLSRFREFFNNGRITDADLDAILADSALLQDNPVLLSREQLQIHKADTLRAALCHDLPRLTATQLNFHMDELRAGEQFQPDVGEHQRRQIRQRAAATEKSNQDREIVADLWNASLQCLGLQHYIFHPEEMLDLSPDQAEGLLNAAAANLPESDDAIMAHVLVRRQAGALIDDVSSRIGRQLTLRSFLLSLTGEDLLQDVRPQLIRHLGAYLDQGMAVWHHPGRKHGFYAAWRRCAANDPGWLFDDLADWQDEIDLLPEDPVDAIMHELHRIGVPQALWTEYLETLALEIPGWFGMVLWRQLHPGYNNLDPERVSILDTLAVRLVLDRVHAQRLCRNTWQLEARFDVLLGYFRKHRSDFFVRYHVHSSRLPEYLTLQARKLIDRYDPVRDDYHQWEQMADMIWTWQQSPASDHPVGYTVYHSAWRLFRLAQHLGLSSHDVRALDSDALKVIFSVLDLEEEALALLWLQAYEHHYREELLNALAQNRAQEQVLEDERPLAQVIFCMDDREESIRRHLEEQNPRIETMGAAGFFGVAINWRGLDDEKVSPLCPIVVTPAHEIREQRREAALVQYQLHQYRRRLRLQWKNRLHRQSVRGLLSSAALITLAAPWTLLSLILKSLAPRVTGIWLQHWRQRFDQTVATELTLTATTDTAATPEQPRLGFTEEEQADRVQNFLQTAGLTTRHGRLVVMMGHGSDSQNNPHLAAYDCGACSGRHGGPNARVFAALANLDTVRKRLRERGLVIPEDTWFIGAEHNTADDKIQWYDLDCMPADHMQDLQQLQRDLDAALLGSAHERCRRFASAPVAPSPQQALRHVIARTFDISQARPELGHVTNAAAFIGRRRATRGAFFDRRLFLISYDPHIDVEGCIIEAILLAAGPVGAGINLEYYFSTVNNDRYGCGTKVVHNVTGMLGVMEGTSSDLRTGLPLQMIEIHEAMRLQIVVEARTEILTMIYKRQPIIQELVGNAWVHLISMDPESGALKIFQPDKGFVPWQASATHLPEVASSMDWYRHSREPLSPSLIRQGGGSG